MGRNSKKNHTPTQRVTGGKGWWKRMCWGSRKHGSYEVNMSGAAYERDDNGCLRRIDDGKDHERRAVR